MDVIKEYFEQNSSWWVNNNYGENVGYYPVGENRLRILLEMLEKSELTGKDVLDIGCGGGNVSFALANSGYNAIGVDRSQNMLDLANQKKAESGSEIQDKIEFRLSEFDDIAEAVGEKKFDAIIAMGFIGYIENDDLFFEKVVPLLKKNGRLFVSCRNRLFNMFDGSKYRKMEIETGGALELINEIETLYTQEPSENMMVEFQDRVKKLQMQDLSLLSNNNLERKEEQKVKDITLEPRQHTPNNLRNNAEKYGLLHRETVGVHPHVINAKYNEHGMPQIYKALSDTLCAFEKLPISLTWSSVFLSSFVKQ